MKKKMQMVEQVEEALKDYILEHKIKPGESLPSEGFFQEHFGVSRATLREAIRRLSAVNLIQTRHGVGHFVGKGDIVHVSNSLLFSLSAGKGHFKDILDIRIALESHFLLQVVNVIQPETLELLHEKLKEMEEAVQKLDPQKDNENQLIRLHRDFHKLIYRDLNNIFLLEFVDVFSKLHEQLHQQGYLYTRQFDKFLEQHQRLYSALKNGEKGKILDELECHFDELTSHQAQMKEGK